MKKIKTTNSLKDARLYQTLFVDINMPYLSAEVRATPKTGYIKATYMQVHSALIMASNGNITSRSILKALDTVCSTGKGLTVSLAAINRK